MRTTLKKSASIMSQECRGHDESTWADRGTVISVSAAAISSHRSHRPAAVPSTLHGASRGLGRVISFAQSAIGRTWQSAHFVHPVGLLINLKKRSSRQLLLALNELFRDWQRTQTQSSVEALRARDSKWMSGSAERRNRCREAHCARRTSWNC